MSINIDFYVKIFHIKVKEHEILYNNGIFQFSPRISIYEDNRLNVRP